jgi:ATP-binding cassette subfamily B protein
LVVYKITKKHVFVSDPAHGKTRLTIEEFCKAWHSTKENGEDVGTALLLEPSPDFYTYEEEKQDKKGFLFLFQYLRPYKKFMVQLALGLLVGSLMQLILPFLTQSLVDIGINNQDIDFVYLILIAQLVLAVSRISVEFIRSWILLHMSTRINISLISDFLAKLMRLPISFFDTKMIGDIMQRIGDHRRVQSFLTSQTLSILFSFVNLLIFSIVMAIYSVKIVLIFFGFSFAYIGWILIFMKRRKDLDYRSFTQMSNNQSNLFQLINGMQEIKLNNCEKQKRWEWESIQAKLFRISIKGLNLSQTQQAGSFLINETKNILITVIAATAVISNDITLGMMLSIQYIIGQMNAPIGQFIGFIHAAQDAKISLERLGEIHNKEDEEKIEENKIRILPDNKNITLENLLFQYEGPHSEKVLNNINLEIPANKTTAIVGTSGSGKTTLVKMLLGFYEPVKGRIKIGSNTLTNYSNSWWRSKCGAVMQDGFIFTDTIAKNIAISSEKIDTEQLLYAVKKANIQDFIESLPLSYNTKIGAEGHGLSQGQKQRILIARLIYKNPDFLFFDEATNSLDTENERVIMENMKEIYKGKTVVVVAHRLSTVKNADKIVVLKSGEVIEEGTHQELIKKRGGYYNLVKNQLELGS